MDKLKQKEQDLYSRPLGLRDYIYFLGILIVIILMECWEYLKKKVR